MLRAAVAALLLAAAPAAGQGVPSGQPVVLWEIRWERVPGAEGEAAQMVLRFIAPQIGHEGGPGFDAAGPDMDWLCETHALPVAALPYAAGDVAVITLMDRPVPRGVPDPEATQFFQVYDLESGACEPGANL